MTLTEFLDTLTTSAPGYLWHLHPTARCLRGVAYHTYCPLTAVCHSQTGEYFSLSQWGMAARALGIAPEDTQAIMRAADHPEDTPLRQALLVAVGLAPALVD